jgi:hypothetical protein
MPTARDEANRRAARDQETELSTLRADLRVIARLNAWNVVSTGVCTLVRGERVGQVERVGLHVGRGR